MSLTLYYHPLASFCHKVLIALYENGTPFEAHIVDLMDDAAASAQFLDLWPVGKIPVLRDEARDRTVPETTIIIEYLDRHYPGAHRRCCPADETGASTRGCGIASSISTCRCRCRRSSPTACARRASAIRAASPRRRRLCPSPTHARAAHGGPRLGGRRQLRPGGLRGGAGAVLRGHRRAVRGARTRTPPAISSASCSGLRSRAPSSRRSPIFTCSRSRSGSRRASSPAKARHEHTQRKSASASSSRGAAPTWCR